MWCRWRKESMKKTCGQKKRHSTQDSSSQLLIDYYNKLLMFNFVSSKRLQKRTIVESPLCGYFWGGGATIAKRISCDCCCFSTFWHFSVVFCFQLLCAAGIFFCSIINHPEILKKNIFSQFLNMDKERYALSNSHKFVLKSINKSYQQIFVAAAGAERNILWRFFCKYSERNTAGAGNGF